MTTKLEQFKKRRKLEETVKKYARKARPWVAAGLALWGIFKADELTKKINITERNVLYRAKQEVKYAGGDIDQNEDQVNRRTVTQIFKGNPEGSEQKQGHLLAISERYVSDDMQTYHLKDETDWKVASSDLSVERVQGGIRVRGFAHYEEQGGILYSKDASKKENEDVLYIHRIDPERFDISTLSADEVEVDITRKDGKKTLNNRLVETRSAPLGWFSDRSFRAGTSLEKYTADMSDDRVKQLISTFEEFNKKRDLLEQKEKERILDQVLKIEESIPRTPIYKSFEDGIIDWNFQESTIYLAQEPSMWQRAYIDALLTTQLPRSWVLPEGVLRVENHWNFWPGNYPFLKETRYETETRVFSLFDKTNNGGYEIMDGKGTVAEIRIEDFLLNYGTALIYHYYVDENGDGNIDRESELVGQVLFRITRGQEERIVENLGLGQAKKDISYEYVYSFMGGHSTEPNERMRDFMLCAAIETAMADALNRGYGKHSSLGFINEVRSDIILREDQRIENMSRALNEENALVAASDMYTLLKAARRPYAEVFGEKVGLIPPRQVTVPAKADSTIAPPITPSAKYDSTNTNEVKDTIRTEKK